ncbi:Homeobox-leucine zipper protein HOX32 [Forsythia ovata]|uniref:Homeobox-leucine zipper protein HOX32 n=1 Tax=Forsythia ovata TaxID=205694 RepID=A0ABD1R3N8_9LAMI
MAYLNVFPKKLVRLLKEHHPEWMDFNFDAHSAALLKAGLLVFQGLNTLHVVERKMLLGNTTNGNERDGEDTCLPGADSSKFPCLMFIVAYQFSFSTHLQEDVASMAQQYVYHVILSQKSISLEVTSGSYLVMNSTEPKFSLNSIHAVNLANWIGQSYRSTLGVEFLSFNCQSSDSLLEHSSSFTSIPVCLHANQPALYVQEGTLENLQALEMDKLFDDSGNISLQSDVPTIVHQGSQYFLLVTEHNVLYGQAVVQRIDKRNGPVECVALALIN